MRRLLGVIIVVALACGVPLAAQALDAPPPTEATGPDGAVVTFAGENCTPASGSVFAIGTTAVTCDDGSFNVVVQDTTAPTVTVADVTDTATDPAGKTIHYSASAADAVGVADFSCDHPNDSTYPIGQTTVGCSARDGANNSASGSFVITVLDGVPPQIGAAPGDITETTESPSGKVISYAKPAASDNIGGTLPVACTKEPGTTFPVGDTTVTCTATDAAGNAASVSFGVHLTLVDTTKPVLSGVPANITQETENPAGSAVGYAAPTATDNVDGPLGVSCSKASGSLFPVGATTVTCSATDAHGNSTQASFTVTVVLVDHTAPTFGGVPAGRVVEQNAPEGAFVSFPAPTANDSRDGPIPAVTCTPRSGSLFPPGITTVVCTAADSHGNVGTATFPVVVRDSTPPAIYPPADRSVVATSASGIPASHPSVASFLSGAVAQDFVDPHPLFSNDAPAFFPLGVTVVTFTARDSAGNEAARSATLTVLPPGSPAPATPPPTRIPPEVTNVTVTPGTGSLRLRWQRPAGVDHFVVRRTHPEPATMVYTGTAVTYLDTGLENGTEYRYVISTADASGITSRGVAIAALPQPNLLRTPADGARLRKAPKLTWRSNAEADYYNVQLFRNGVKVLSAWPVKPAYALRRAWRFQGVKYTLAPGLYQWYVWPGFGARAAVDYGDALGSKTFQIVR